MKRLPNGTVISEERIAHNGHLVLSAIWDGHLVHQTYIDYTKKEARRLFRQHLRDTRK